MTREALQHASIGALWPHQRATLSFCVDAPRVLDTSDAGTGKTAGHLIRYSLRPKPRGRMLVLCPKTLMMTAWGEDCEKFTPELTMTFAFAEQRDEAFQMKSDIVVLNHDGVKWLADKKNLKYLAEFDHLVIDEFDAFKHPTSQRSKAAAKIRKHFQYRYGLNGTAGANSVMDVWHPALLIDDGKRLGTSFFKLRNAVQTPTQVGPNANHIRWDDKPGAPQAVDELLADITIRHEFEKVMTHVPPNHMDTKRFDLAPKARKLYDKMEHDLILALDEGKVVSAVHAASLRTKLLQIASGAVYDGDKDGSYTVLDPTRYELIADLVERSQHAVVFFNWRHQRDLLAAAFDKRGWSFAAIDGSVTKRGERERIVSGFQAGDYKVLLLHPRTGAHGLTLTRGDTTIFASPIYEADLLKQGRARIHRGTQDKVTHTILVEAKNTVEQKVYARLDEKSARMNDLLSLMADRRK